ncbi:hypothetical protein Tco_0969349 [Tanacetum coccineum]
MVAAWDGSRGDSRVVRWVAAVAETDGGGEARGGEWVRGSNRSGDEECFVELAGKVHWKCFPAATTGGRRRHGGRRHGYSKSGDEVFSTWMELEGNTRNLGSFGEETDKITNLHQISSRIVFTERGDGVAGIKRRRHDLFGLLKEDLESSIRVLGVSL